MWDKMGGYLLLSKHDPLKCDRGEGGIDNDDRSLSSPSQMKSNRARKPSNKKGDLPPTSIAAFMQSFIDFSNDRKSMKKDGKSVGEYINK